MCDWIMTALLWLGGLAIYFALVCLVGRFIWRGMQ